VSEEAHGHVSKGFFLPGKLLVEVGDSWVKFSLAEGGELEEVDRLWVYSGEDKLIRAKAGGGGKKVGWGSIRPEEFKKPRSRRSWWIRPGRTGTR